MATVRFWRLLVGAGTDRRGMTTSQSDFQLNRPGALIAALPAVLGFVPEKSLVLVTIDRGELGCVMRVDLSPELFGSVGHIAEVAAAAAPDCRDRCRCRRRGRRLPVVQRRLPGSPQGAGRPPCRPLDRAARLPRRRHGRSRAGDGTAWTAAGARLTTRRRRRWRWRRCWTVDGSTPAARSFRRSSRSPMRPRATP